jgi:DNA helicase IV
VAGEPDRRTGLRRLYVCLTRAVSGLAVLHASELPGALG